MAEKTLEEIKAEEGVKAAEAVRNASESLEEERGDAPVENEDGIRHFDGSVLKTLKDGSTTISSYVDSNAGESLPSDPDQIEKREKAEAKAAKAAAPATTAAPAAAPAPAAPKAADAK